MYRSALPGFYRLDVHERVETLSLATDLSAADVATLSSVGGLTPEQANHMAENVVGVFSLPLGLCANLRVDGEDRIVPMAVEEPSVIAGASHGAKLLRAGGGVMTRATAPHMIGQIQLLDVREDRSVVAVVAEHRERLLAIANDLHPRLVAAGGGALDLEVRRLDPLDASDPLGTMWIVHVVVDVRDAMGANAINSMCERLAPELAELTGARVNLRILSNLTDRRTVTVEGRVPFDALPEETPEARERLARAIVEASVFAERDPYRAATHNKGIMNGVDAVLIALGQDFRAVEAGAHAFAARDGQYRALARWRVEGDALVGRMELPMAVGTVGGVVDVHPTVRVLRRVARVDGATDLGALAAAVGLAQNLGALRALASEGIQRGHMRLHARNLAVQAGAEGAAVTAVAESIASRGTITKEAAERAVASLRRTSRGNGAPVEPEVRTAGRAS